MKNIEELLQEINYINKKIIICGAGYVGKTVAKELLNLDIDILCFVVSNRENNPYQILGIPVLCIDNLDIPNESSVFIVSTLEKTQEDIYINISQRGFDQIYNMTDSLYYEWKKKQNELYISDKMNYIYRYVEPSLKSVIQLCEENNLNDRLIEKEVIHTVDIIKKNDLLISRMVVVLGTKCSLRCKDCNNLMPYFKPQEDLNIEKIIDSLDKIVKETNTIIKCELVGGEPLLSNNFETVMKYVIDNNKIRSIEITTNGTILPNNRQISLLRNEKVLVRISDYGTLADKNKLIKCLVKNSIRYIVLDLEDWAAVGNVEYKNRDVETLKKQYKQCLAGYNCKTLYESKIFSCARAASMYALGLMKEKEYVDIEKGFIGDNMKKFILKDYSIACNYCDLASIDERRVEPAIQLPK